LKKLFLFLILLAIPALAQAEDSTTEPPQWSFEIKGGLFYPALSNFSQYYGEKDVPQYSLALAYKIIRQIDIGVEGGYITARGTASAPLHGIMTGSVTLDLIPVNAFLLFRGVLSEQQWIVPYAGGGYTKILYNEAIENQSSVKGSANGYHVRGGLQFLLDALDTESANEFQSEYGVNHTYLFVEAEYTHALTSSVNLGGTGYLVGLLFEF